MNAAFDYARVARQQGRKPTLLFIAHRKEILAQALGAFRGVLRDQNFGDLLVDGSTPEQDFHAFCSIQSYNSRNLVTEAADKYDYIVIDEFHHVAAPPVTRLCSNMSNRRYSWA